MNKIKEFLVGTREFEITPNYNSEYVQKKVQEEHQQSGLLFLGFRVDYYVDNRFKATYKFGKGLATSLYGQILDKSICITCKPHIVMVVFLSFIIISVISGIYFISEGGSDKLTGSFLLIFGIGLYVIMAFVIQWIHKISIKKLLAIINGGKIN